MLAAFPLTESPIILDEFVGLPAWHGHSSLGLTATFKELKVSTTGTRLYPRSSLNSSIKSSIAARTK